MTHAPTPEQSAILDHCTGTDYPSLMINALAGTGKSATLKMIDRASRVRPAIYLVFNRRNADEAIAAKKAGEFRDTTEIKTFNGLGHGVWAKVVGGVSLSKSKTRDIWRQMTDNMSRNDAAFAWSQYGIVMDGIEKAKAHGYIPPACKIAQGLATADDLAEAMDERPSADALALIDEVLLTSIKQAYDGIIDFNDQIYMPALFEGNFPRFPRIMIDEYQDQNMVNHRMIQKLVGKHNPRLIGVGDPNQNIYGFRGARAAGMADAVDHYAMTELPLSVSFRCPSEIVKAAQWHVPHFQWSKIGGTVSHAERFDHTSFPDSATIICRNNAPLLRLAFRLISVGRSVTVVGSELGPRLVAVMRKLGDATMSRRDVFSAIEEWREARLLAGSKSAGDLADCMRVFAEHADTLSGAISYAEHIFAQKGTIRLLTGHKSKGLEFDNVFWLDPGLVDTTREQDANLAYVITTRSQNSLTLLDSMGIVW
jgi:hypothetical protein